MPQIFLVPPKGFHIARIAAHFCQLLFYYFDFHQRFPSTIKGWRTRVWKINKQKRWLKAGKKEFERISVAISFNSSSRDFSRRKKNVRALAEKWKYTKFCKCSLSYLWRRSSTNTQIRSKWLFWNKPLHEIEWIKKIVQKHRENKKRRFYTNHIY